MLEDKGVQPLVIEAAAHWRDRCLLEDGSIFTEQSLWTLKNVQQLVRHYVENPDASGEGFFAKLSKQLKPVSPETRKLMAEMLWVLYLVVSSTAMQGRTKRRQFEKVWGWSGEEVPDDQYLLGSVLDAGVAHPGTAYHTHRWRELAFFIRLMERWKGLPRHNQQELLRDGWSFVAWVDGQKESKGRQLRHALAHLLFADLFEPILTSSHKRAIVERWLQDVCRSPEDFDNNDRLSIDRAVKEIRDALEESSSDGPVDFYREPWESEWREKKPLRKAVQALQSSREDGADAAWARSEFGDAKAWILGAGEGGRLWPEFRREGITAVGFSGLGDLSEYGSKEEIRQAISETHNVDNPINDALAGWQFANEIQVGDHVFAKQGRLKLLGWGTVKSGYRYEPDRAEYRNVLDVDWHEKGRLGVT